MWNIVIILNIYSYFKHSIFSLFVLVCGGFLVVFFGFVSIIGKDCPISFSLSLGQEEIQRNAVNFNVSL